MPFYLYKCPECSEEWTLMQSIHDLDKPGMNCPLCGDVLMQRQPSVTSFSVKGFSAANGYSKGRK